MVQIFFIYSFFWFFCFSWIIPCFILWPFLFPAIVISSLISYVKSVTKIFLGIPLFSLLSLVYARIGIGTIEVTANTQQVLAVPAQTAKPLRLHRPSRVISCPMGFVYRTLCKSLYEVSRLNGLAFLKQLTVLLSKREGPMDSSSTNVFLSPLLYLLTEFCYYEGCVIQQKRY